MRVRLMAAVLSSLLALFGLGGCTKAPPPEEPFILDGPGMFFDPRNLFTAEIWVDPVSGQVLTFEEDTLTLKEGDRVIWSGEWQLLSPEVSDAHTAVPRAGGSVGPYERIVYHYAEPLGDGQTQDAYLIAFAADHASDAEGIRFITAHEMKYLTWKQPDSP